MEQRSVWQSFVKKVRDEDELLLELQDVLREVHHQPPRPPWWTLRWAQFVVIGVLLSTLAVGVTLLLVLGTLPVGR